MNVHKMFSGCIRRRLFVYTGGIFLMAFGVGLSVKSNLGISPVNSVPYALSAITGIDQGMLTTLVFCIFILLQILLLRRDFRLHQLLQAACAALFGGFVSLSNHALGAVTLASYALRLAFSMASVLFISAGMFLYLSAELIPQPLEGLCLAIQARFGFRYANIKVGLDCMLVAAAAALSWRFTGGIVGFREGTILAMLSVGRLAGFCMDRWGRRLKVFCFGTAETKAERHLTGRNGI